MSRPERLAGGALLLVAGAAWATLLFQARSMDAMTASNATMTDHMAMAARPLVDPAGLLLDVAAWGVMMAAMMLPSALPMVLLYVRTSRGANHGGSRIPVTLFVAGYLALWTAVGLPVSIAGQMFTRVLAAHSHLAALSPYAVAGVLAVAGVYQFTPLKSVCLRSCQSPMGFLIAHWQPGSRGALRLSINHAMYCLGCCWGLMAVLVVAGAMQLVWVITIAVVVFVEKVVPPGKAMGRTAGSLLLALGAAVLLRPELSMVLSSST